MVSFCFNRCHVHLWSARALLSQEAPGWRVWIQSTVWVAGCRANAAEFTPLGAYGVDRWSTHRESTPINAPIRWEVLFLHFFFFCTCFVLTDVFCPSQSPWVCDEWRINSSMCNSWTSFKRNSGIKWLHFRLQCYFTVPQGLWHLPLTSCQWTTVCSSLTALSSLWLLWPSKCIGGTKWQVGWIVHIWIPQKYDGAKCQWKIELWLFLTAAVFGVARKLEVDWDGVFLIWLFYLTMLTLYFSYIPPTSPAPSFKGLAQMIFEGFFSSIITKIFRESCRLQAALVAPAIFGLQNNWNLHQ